MWEGQSYRFYARYCGTKGDWPFLRSAFRLWSGYTSLRVCHLCPGTDARLHFLILFGCPRIGMIYPQQAPFASGQKMGWLTAHIGLGRRRA